MNRLFYSFTIRTSSSSISYMVIIIGGGAIVVLIPWVAVDIGDWGGDAYKSTCWGLKVASLVRNASAARQALTVARFSLLLRSSFRSVMKTGISIILGVIASLEGGDCPEDAMCNCVYQCTSGSCLRGIQCRS